MAEPAGKGPDGERFTQEELDVVRSAGLFETYLGRGWFRSLIIYGVPAIAALLIAAGIFSSLIEVSETLLLYSQPSWVPGRQVGLRVAVMDREGEFVPVTELEMTLHDRERGRSERLVQGLAHGTKAASLSVVAPGWPDGQYELADVYDGETDSHLKSFWIRAVAGVGAWYRVIPRLSVGVLVDFGWPGLVSAMATVGFHWGGRR